MTAVVLSVIAGWFVLSALTAVALGLVARGRSQEEYRRRCFDAELERWLSGGDHPRPAVAEPDGTGG
jgi:hypothetical protein